MFQSLGHKDFMVLDFEGDGLLDCDMGVPAVQGFRV